LFSVQCSNVQCSLTNIVQCSLTNIVQCSILINVQSSDKHSVTVFTVESTDKKPGVTLAFSHVHMYVDMLEKLEGYQRLDEKIKFFSVQQSANLSKGGIVCSESFDGYSIGLDQRLNELASAWREVVNKSEQHDYVSKMPKNNNFVTQNWDIVQQLISALRYRVIRACTPNYCKVGCQRLCKFCYSWRIRKVSEARYHDVLRTEHMNEKCLNKGLRY